MWLTGLVAPRRVGSSQTRVRTRVPCIGRQILNHRATREAPPSIFVFHFWTLGNFKILQAYLVYVPLMSQNQPFLQGNFFLFLRMVLETQIWEQNVFVVTVVLFLLFLLLLLGFYFFKTQCITDLLGTLICHFLCFPIKISEYIRGH